MAESDFLVLDYRHTRQIIGSALEVAGTQFRNIPLKTLLCYSHIIFLYYLRIKVLIIVLFIYYIIKKF